MMGRMKGGRRGRGGGGGGSRICSYIYILFFFLSSLAFSLGLLYMHFITTLTCGRDGLEMDRTRMGWCFIDFEMSFLLLWLPPSYIQWVREIDSLTLYPFYIFLFGKFFEYILVAMSWRIYTYIQYALQSAQIYFFYSEP